MPLAEKGVRGKAAGLAPPQHIETRSATSAPNPEPDSKAAVVKAFGISCCCRPP